LIPAGDSKLRVHLVDRVVDGLQQLRLLGNRALALFAAGYVACGFRDANNLARSTKNGRDRQ
jgi:hypothetical protein